MDYFPVTLYSKRPEYWPDIDDRLRSAAINREVKVRLLMAKWNHTRSNAFQFLHSLADLSNTYPGVDIEIKLFIVPADAEQKKIPFARVNHNKYMVTDKTAFIGTSNWSADYFIDTAGVGFLATPEENQANSSNIRQQLAHVFERDWNSSYAHPLKDFLRS
jgi:phospholipase D3/4